MQKYLRLFTMSLLVALMGLMVACGSDDDDGDDAPVENTPAPAALNVGDEAPPFTLPAVDSPDVSLADYVGQQPVLLYFHMAMG